MEYKQKLQEYIDSMEADEIIFVSRLYDEHFAGVSDAAFFKTIERMTKDGSLIRVSKGIYARPEATPQQIETGVLNFYFGENNDAGMYIGLKMYNKYSLTGVTDNNSILYSNITKQDKKVIRRITIYRCPVELTYDHAKIIEFLEVLENYNNIPKLDKKQFIRFTSQMSKAYDDQSARQVQDSMKYQKSTIAFLKNILDKHGVSNTIGTYLSKASRYRIPEIDYGGAEI